MQYMSERREENQGRGRGSAVKRSEGTVSPGAELWWQMAVSLRVGGGD